MISPPAVPVLPSVAHYHIYMTATTVDARRCQNVLAKAEFFVYTSGSHTGSSCKRVSHVASGGASIAGSARFRSFWFDRNRVDPGTNGNGKLPNQRFEATRYPRASTVTLGGGERG